MDNELFDALGFRWNRDVVARDVATHSVERACFRFNRMLPDFVWDASVLEGNPFTFPEVKTVLDGVTVGGRKLSDQDQVLNLAESSRHLLKAVRSGAFSLDKSTACEIHSLVARREALEWGHFRGEGAEKHYTPGVGLGEAGTYMPIATEDGAPELKRVFTEGVRALQSLVASPYERGCAYFLFGALQQFFFDGNKRTSRFLMNGVLMSSGIDAISVPAARALEFNEKMTRFYLGRDGSEMMTMLWSCHPDAAPLAAAPTIGPSILRSGSSDPEPGEALDPQVPVARPPSGKIR